MSATGFRQGCAFVGLLCVAAVATTARAQENLGYTDTPMIPGSQFRVHDGARPQPRIVTPAETFSHGAKAPADAIVLFDGKDLNKWQTPQGGPPNWTIQEDYMQVARRGGLIRTKDKFPDFQLHLEFATPQEVTGTGQGRGNSGLMINGMYEVQILDSYDNKTYPDGQAGALYGQSPPLVNASKAPGQWQSYDVIFESPRWDASETLVKKANVTVIHNGILLHHRKEYFGATDGIGGVAHKALGAYVKPHPPEVHLELQDHSNPVRYRNIWIRPLGEYDAVSAPAAKEGTAATPATGEK